jgi:hypothetical protein
MTSNDTWELVAPTVAPVATWVRFAPRTPARLHKPWGFIDTSKVNADLFIRRLRERAHGELGVPSLVVAKPAPGVGLTDAQVDQLASECGAVVACFGD